MAATDGLSAEFIAFAHRLADASGAAILLRFRSGLAVDDKSVGGTFDPVTEADRAAESVIREMIARRYPSHGIIGEEYGEESTGAEFVWVLDPIDGTKAFISGMPVWGTLIGLLHAGEPMIGMADHPQLRERFWGDGRRSHGFGQQGERNLKTRQPVPIENAVLWAGSTVIDNAPLFARLRDIGTNIRMLRFGSDCYAMAMLAEGHIDAVIETGLDIYDVAATVPIVTGAGGIMTAPDGSTAIHSRTIIACGDPVLHAELLKLLAWR